MFHRAGATYLAALQPWGVQVVRPFQTSVWLGWYLLLLKSACPLGRRLWHRLAPPLSANTASPQTLPPCLGPCDKAGAHKTLGPRGALCWPCAHIGFASTPILWGFAAPSVGQTNAVPTNNRVLLVTLPT